MFLAQEFDAVDGGEPYISAERPRIVDPDLRSRVYGYLATAPVAGPGLRTDGVWVWPESLAPHVTECGRGPQAQLLDHLAARRYLLPRDIDADVYADAVTARSGSTRPTPDPPARRSTYFASSGRNSGWHQLRRVVRQDDGSTVEHTFARGGWEPSRLVSAEPPPARAAEFREVPPREAARLADLVCQERYAARRDGAREAPGTGGLLWARVFDGESPEGTPWFSPGRLRIPERERRLRLARYLTGGRLVMRAAGTMVDPLDPEREPAVPLNYRTDGTWLWQEALAYYVGTRGVAPELDLLCHIEQRGHRPPTNVPDEAVHAAVAAIKAGPPPRRTQPSYVYYYDGDGVVRAARGDPFEADALDRDLRWSDTDLLAAQRYRGSDNQLVEITEAEAVRLIDEAWVRADEREVAAGTD